MQNIVKYNSTNNDFKCKLAKLDLKFRHQRAKMVVLLLACDSHIHTCGWSLFSLYVLPSEWACSLLLPFAQVSSP